MRVNCNNFLSRHLESLNVVVMLCRHYYAILKPMKDMQHEKCTTDELKSLHISTYLAK